MMKRAILIAALLATPVQALPADKPALPMAGRFQSPEQALPPRIWRRAENCFRPPAGAPPASGLHNACAYDVTVIYCTPDKCPDERQQILIPAGQSLEGAPFDAAPPRIALAACQAPAAPVQLSYEGGVFTYLCDR